jgi:hypothetical protein
VLIDRTHKRWFVATLLIAAGALALWIVLDALSPERLRGGSTVGLWYGTVGSFLMVYAGLLAAHRRLMRWQWLGARQTWLRGHIWLGLLSGLFLLLHSGLRWGGLLERLLWVAVIGTLVTGIVGLALQQALPRALTTRIRAEAPYEQIPHLCQVMRRKADALVDAVCGDLDAPAPIESTQGSAGLVETGGILGLAENGKFRLWTFYNKEVRPFLSPDFPRRSPLRDPLRAEASFEQLGRLRGLEAAGDKLAELACMCDERRQLADQERLHFWLHAWLHTHVPFSAAVLVLGVAHVISALYF